MDKKGINEFKKFLQSRGANTIFFGFYKEYHLEDNSDDPMEFLAIVPKKFAIAWSMDFERINNPNFGFKYWNDLDERWKHHISKGNERKPFETTGIEREKTEIKRETKKAVAEVEVPAREGSLLDNDWAGLNLRDVDVKSTKLMRMPNENELRLSVKGKYVVVINSSLVNTLSGADIDSCAIQCDTNTNRLVIVFGKDKPFNITNYSKDVKAIQYKELVKYIEKYLQVKFEEDQVYYLRIAERMWSKSHTQFAVILAQKFTYQKR